MDHSFPQAPGPPRIPQVAPDAPQLPVPDHCAPRHPAPTEYAENFWSRSPLPQFGQAAVWLPMTRASKGRLH